MFTGFDVGADRLETVIYLVTCPSGYPGGESSSDLGRSLRNTQAVWLAAADWRPSTGVSWRVIQRKIRNKKLGGVSVYNFGHLSLDKTNQPNKIKNIIHTGLLFKLGFV